MEFAQPRSADDPGRRDQRSRGSGGMMRALPVIVALDENKDGEISSDEIEKAEAALAKLDKNGDGKLSGDEVRPSRDGGQRERRPGGQARNSGKPQAEVERILEFGTEEEIVELAREVEPRQFFEAMRDMDFEDRRKIMRALPEEIRRQFRNRRSGTRERGVDRGSGRQRAGRGDQVGGDRPERRGAWARGPG